jgi:1-acyl-sn-glycerol-3-phosphate acyltransferase
VLFGLNTVFWVLLFIPIIFIKIIIPHTEIRHQCSLFLIFLAARWVDCNSFILRITQDIEWDVQGIGDPDPKGSYLVVSNHRSWADTFVLQHIFKGRIPFLKFFLKRELIWVPFLGIAWWALEFPFMKRYSRQFLEKHPELRGKDMETTRKFCERLKEYPGSIMNYVEGTRFDFQKHQKQNAPYRHLLMPKAGGVALVFSAMGDCLSSVLDVTIVYPENEPPVRFLELLTGNVPRIIVRVKTLPVPENVVDKDYQNDKAYREKIQQWINQLWQEKDQRIERIMNASRVVQGRE